MWAPEEGFSRQRDRTGGILCSASPGDMFIVSFLSTRLKESFILSISIFFEPKTACHLAGTQ